ncbi:MAG: hypothetical protein CMQ34_15665 [Gammaproteobacteria bacterium]|nr:hypothetical protein [Gammaproteobacteria bacterium]
MKATVFSVLLSLLLMPVVAAQAQQQTAEPEPSGQQADGDGSAGQQTGDADTDTGAESASDLPDIDSQPIEGAQNSGPGRFIPSEQISQDFGVSFPVDI